MSFVTRMSLEEAACVHNTLSLRGCFAILIQDRFEGYIELSVEQDKYVISRCSEKANVWWLAYAYAAANRLEVASSS